MGTGARPQPRSLFVSWDLAVVDPLLVHPFSTEPLLSCEQVDRVRAHFGVAADRHLILGAAIHRPDDGAYQDKTSAE
jgi:hypothetical protein